MTDTSPKDKLRIGIYLLPNLFTSAGLFAGFYGIVAAMKQDYRLAAFAIFLGMIADSLDGRVARLMNAQTSFGAQFDSLADMVTFGVAPALTLYSWILHDYGKIGWLVSFIYAAATALRLARFNSQLGSAQDKKYFTGLPCPAAAAVVTAMIWSGEVQAWHNSIVAIIAGVITVLMALLMVSNLRYHSFKQMSMQERVPFMAMFIIILLIVAIAWDPPHVLFVGFFIYAVSGPVFTVLGRRTLKARKLLRKRWK